MADVCWNIENLIGVMVGTQHYDADQQVLVPEKTDGAAPHPSLDGRFTKRAGDMVAGESFFVGRTGHYKITSIEGA